MKLNDIIKYCLSFEGAFKRYPFPRSGNPLIMSVDGTKMFCIIYENTKPLHISLKCEPVEADILRQMYNSVKSGYHLNKSHWNSVYIDGSVPPKEIKRMIFNSYHLVKNKRKHKKKE